MARRRQLGTALSNLGQGLFQFGTQRSLQQQEEEELQARLQAQQQAQRPDQLLRLAQLVQGGMDPSALQGLAQASNIDLSGMDLSQFQPPEESAREKLRPLTDFIVQNPQLATPEVVSLLASQFGVDPQQTGVPSQSPQLPPVEGLQTSRQAPEVQQLQQLGGALQAATPRERAKPITVGSSQRLFDPETQKVILDAIQQRERPIQASPGSVVLDPQTMQPVFKVPFAPQAGPSPRVNEQTIVADMSLANVPGMRPQLVGKPVRVQYENGEPVRVLGEAPASVNPLELLMSGGPQGGGQGTPPATPGAVGPNPFRK